MGERPPSLPCPPPEAVPLEAQAIAAGEVGDSAPGSAAMAEALHAPFTAGELVAAIRRTHGRACVVGPLKPTVLKRLAPLMAPILADMFCACASWVGRLPWWWAVSCISPRSGSSGPVCGVVHGRSASSLAALFAVTVTSWQSFPVPSAPCMTDTILLSGSPALTLSQSFPWQRVWPSAP